LVDNDRFAETGELYSLFRADDALGGAVVLLYGDIVFEQSVLERLLRTTADVALVVDRAFPDLLRAGHAGPKPADPVGTDGPSAGARWLAREGGSRVLRIGPEVPPEEAHGEFIGLAACSAAGAARLRAVHAELAVQRAEGLEQASLTHLLQATIDRGFSVT